jgi:hypothetical protein
VPFKSKAQQGFMFANKPKAAKTLATDTTPAQFKALPARVNPPVKAARNAKRATPARGASRS